jgi:hypothetical protein
MAGGLAYCLWWIINQTYSTRYTKSFERNFDAALYNSGSNSKTSAGYHSRRISIYKNGTIAKKSAISQQIALRLGLLHRLGLKRRYLLRHHYKDLTVRLP